MRHVSWVLGSRFTVSDVWATDAYSDTGYPLSEGDSHGLLLLDCCRGLDVLDGLAVEEDGCQDVLPFVLRAGAILDLELVHAVMAHCDKMVSFSL